MLHCNYVGGRFGNPVCSYYIVFLSPWIVAHLGEAISSRCRCRCGSESLGRSRADAVIWIAFAIVLEPDLQAEIVNLRLVHYFDSSTVVVCLLNRLA